MCKAKSMQYAIGAVNAPSLGIAVLILQSEAIVSMHTYWLLFLMPLAVHKS